MLTIPVHRDKSESLQTSRRHSGYSDSVFH